MKVRIIKFLILIIFTGSIYSCEDYLSESDPNLLSSETYWRNLNDTKSGLTGAYAALLNHFILNIDAEGCRADMGWPGYGRPSPMGAGPVTFYYHTYTATTPQVERKWQALYLGIFRANQVIEGLNKIEDQMTEDQMETWKVQMGQARFLRGLFHFYAYQSYNNGSIIIRDELALTQEEFSKPLSSPEDVIAFVRTDLEYAYENLPSKYTEPADQGRITAGAAATILGNSYLFEGEYIKAMEYYNDVITNPDYGYELVNNIDLMFTLEGELNKESILEICYNTEFRTELSQWDEESLHNRWAQVTGSNTGNLNPAWLSYSYKSEGMDTLDSRNYYDNPHTGLRELRNVSLRASAMVTLVEDQQSLYYGKPTTEKANFSWNGWGFGLSKKYTNHDHLTAENESGGSPWQSEKNVTLNRLAEVYINMAECILKSSGDVNAALDLINANRARWGLILLGKSGSDISHTYDEADYSADELMDFIMYVEKPLELSNEGHMIRWIDMRRWGITAQRLNDLAQQTYYAIDYSFIGENSKSQKKGRASVVKLVPVGYDGEIAVIDYEYIQSAQNYKPEVNDYYTIPSSETGVNTTFK